MNILWVTSILLPDALEHLNMPSLASGGWLVYFLELLKKDDRINLSIISTYSGKQYKKFNTDNVTYHLIPSNKLDLLSSGKKNDELLKEIVNQENPDLIHVHGTEFTIALKTLEIFNDRKVVINVQTNASKICEHMNDGMKISDFILNALFREIVSFKGPLARKIFAINRAKKEKKIIDKMKHCIGSTFMDYSYITNTNKKLKYYRCPYIFRKEFYNSQKWSADDIEEFSIFTGQAAAPLKGLHMLIKAVACLKQDIPGVKLYIPGVDLSNPYYKKRYSYAKYINRLIKKLNLQENVVFTGQLSASEMAERTRKSNVVVVPSAMELGSSMVWEAMLIGTPVISSFRGGMTDNFIHGESGFYYDYDEIFMLKEYILKIFKDKDLATKFSKNAIKIAEDLHNPEKCKDTFVQAYENIIYGGSNK